MTNQNNAAQPVLPCPFCGSEAFATYKTGDDDIRRHSVHCRGRCGAQMGGGFVSHYSEESAVKAWNRRAALASAPVAGEATDAELDKLYRETITEGPEDDTQLWENPHRFYARAVLSRYAAPQASEAVLEAIQFVLKNFKASEAQGYHTRDRQFAISILEESLSAKPGAQKPHPKQHNDGGAVYD